MLRQGKYFLVVGGRIFGFYDHLPAAKGLRTRRFKGKGDIYELILTPTGPTVSGPVAILMGES